MNLVVVQSRYGRRLFHAAEERGARTVCGAACAGWRPDATASMTCQRCVARLRRGDGSAPQRAVPGLPARSIRGMVPFVPVAWHAVEDAHALSSADLDNLEALAKSASGTRCILTYSPVVALQLIALAREGLDAKARAAPDELKALMRGRKA